MKKTLLTFISVGLISSVGFAVNITNFGSGNFTQQSFGNDFNSAGQTASSFTIFGNEANQLFGGLSSAVNISGAADLLTVAGNFSSGTGAFTITLYDSADNTVSYTGGSFNDLTGGGTSILTFVSNAGADLTDIDTVQLQGAGSPSNGVFGTLTGLDATAVPEPSAFALLAGAFGIASVMVRRRR